MSESVLVRTPDTAVVTVVDARSVVVTPPQPVSSVVVRGVPGPRGIQGLQGPAGDAITVTVGAQPLSGHSVVSVDAFGLLVKADSTDVAQRGAVMGLVANAYAPGELATVLTGYTLAHAGWSWAPGPIFVGAGGQLTQSLPPGAVFSQVVAHALSATLVLIDLQPPIALS